MEYLDVSLVDPRDNALIGWTRQSTQWIVIECKCRYCNERVYRNVTNYSDEYFCRNCDRPTNPPKWPCPFCETEEPVRRNPFDDPAEYYCYECNLAFNRLGASFDSDDIEYDRLEKGFEAATKRLSLEAEETTRTPPRIFEFTLDNIGMESVRVQGKSPIAVQKWITNDDWWTIYGNPERFTPKEEFVLPPGEKLTLELLFSRSRIEGPNFGINQHFTSGEYRILYWGIPRADTVLSTQLQVELRSWDTSVA